MSEIRIEKFSSRKKGKYQSSPYREVCGRCLRPVKTCLCPTIKPFDTETRFVILMHPKEAKKIRMGTGRLTHLFLTNSELRVGIDFSGDDHINALIYDSSYAPFVLYPGDHSANISEYQSYFYKEPVKKRLIFIIDAAWPLAKKILKKSANLGVLPKIHFRPDKSSRYFKKQPHDFCLCTIESAIFLLEAMQKTGIENCNGKYRHMLAAFDKMCRVQSAFQNDPSLPGYRRKGTSFNQKKRAAGKRQRRSVCFEDGG